MLKDFYQNKTVLVTGHTGFKGSWLSLWLHELGAKVFGIALAPEYPNSLFELANLQSKIKHHELDIRNANSLKELIQEIKPEIILHLAAQPLVLRSYKEPSYTFETNVMGTVNLLEAARGLDSVKSIVNVTTDKCYENKEWLYGYREIDALGGYDPYSASKAGSELVSSAYRNSFFNSKDYGRTHHLGLASARAGNVIGGGDWSDDRLVPDTIKALHANETLLLRSPHATRPWQHVLEPLAGYLWLAKRLTEEPCNYNEAFNFGPLDSAAINVESLVKKLINYWGSGSYELINGIQKHEANLLKLDLSKSLQKLKFSAILDVDECLEMTVAWYKEFYYNPKNIENFTRKQIQAYTKKAESSGQAWSQ